MRGEGILAYGSCGSWCSMTFLSSGLLIDMGAAGNWRTSGGLYVACELFVAVDTRDFGVQPSVREIDTNRRTWFHGGGITEDASAFVPDECVAAPEHGERVEVLEAVGKAMKRGAVQRVPALRCSGETCYQLVESSLPGIGLRTRQQQALGEGRRCALRRCPDGAVPRPRGGVPGAAIARAGVRSFRPG